MKLEAICIILNFWEAVFIPLFILASWVNRNIFSPKIKLREREREVALSYLLKQWLTEQEFSILIQWEDQTWKVNRRGKNVLSPISLLTSCKSLARGLPLRASISSYAKMGLMVPTLQSGYAS